ACDRGAEEGPADTRERIEHQIARAAEELDEASHQARGLVRPVGLARLVSELRRIRGRQQRLGEVEPLLAGQLVERVRGVRSAPRLGHAGPAYRTGPVEWPACRPRTRARGSWGATRPSRRWPVR